MRPRRQAASGHVTRAASPSRDAAWRPQGAVWFSPVDVAILGTVFGTTFWFAGRTPLGAELLTIGAVLAAGCVVWDQLRRPTPVWNKSRTWPLWLAATVLLLIQLIPMPATWLSTIDPAWNSLFGSWNDPEFHRLLGAPPDSLSLAPGGTWQAAQLLAGCALVFAATIQRCERTHHVQRLIRGIAAIVALFAVFGLLQFVAGNGKFYWLIDHPFRTTESNPLGPFTNRNHFAQFLALGIGPLLWCLIHSSEEPAVGTATRGFGQPVALHVGPRAIWGMLLAVVTLTALMTTSRGGFVALAAAGCIAGLLLLRRKHGGSGLGFIWAGAALLCALFVGVANIDQIERRFRSDETAWRPMIWQANWDVATEFPWFGTGLGSHINAHHLQLPPTSLEREFTHAESSWLQLASETGFCGFGLAAAASILVAWRAGRVALWDSDQRRSACAAAILASLVGSIVHASVDFVWHVPSCLLIVVVLAACGCRLDALRLAELQNRAGSVPASRRLWLAAAVAVVIVGCGIVPLGIPAVLAEPHVLRYRQLTFLDHSGPAGELDEAAQEFELEREQAAITAARLEPLNSRMQVAAAWSCLVRFERLMSQSEHVLSLSSLHDTVVASQFEDAAAAREWVEKVAGPRIRLLDAVETFCRRAIRASPLEARAYLILSETAFLRDPTGKLQSSLLKQALKLRPTDPSFHYEAGKLALLAGEREEVLHHWSFAFTWGSSYRMRIAEVLAADMTADELLDALQPDWRTIGILAKGYGLTGQTTEQQRLLSLTAQWAREFAETHPEDPLEETAWIAAADALLGLQQTDEACEVLIRAVDRQASSLKLRQMLAESLVKVGRGKEAVVHLRWLAARNPGDQRLQRMLDQAVLDGLDQRRR